MPTDPAILKELQALRALGSEVAQRASRLEVKLSPVQEGASRKGLTPGQKAVLKRNKRIGR